ncbi:MAG: AraC family transcriptional regulator [Cytophagales bacterium]|nr:AraC family transcriptional regulator [Cytophagales bacterium]
MGFVFVLGVVQAFFIEFILLNKKNKNLSDRILAVWMFIIGLHLFLFYLHYAEFIVNYPHLLGLGLPFPLLHGPLLLLYVNSLIDPQKRFYKRNYLHFIPFLFCYALLTPWLMLSVDDLQSHIDLAETNVITPVYLMIILAMTVSTGVIYVTWALLQLRKHQKNLGNNFSYRESVDLKWLRNLILGMGIIWVVVIISNFTLFVNDDSSGDVMIYTTVTIFVFFIGYFGIRQGNVFSDNTHELRENFVEATRVKYEKSSLKKDKGQEYLKALEAYMIDKKPFLESKITLPQLADRLDIQPNNLSQVINENLGKNFYDFINEYRVEEFKRRITSDEGKNITLLGLAYDSGFSSKSTFNEVFKRVTGQTPSGFYKQHLES